MLYRRKLYTHQGALEQVQLSLLPKRMEKQDSVFDYRKLNTVTKMNVYTQPRIGDMLDSLAETHNFTA